MPSPTCEDVSGDALPKEVQIVYRLFLVNCYLLHVPRLPSQLANSRRGWGIDFICLELPWEYIAITRNSHGRLENIWIMMLLSMASKYGQSHFQWSQGNQDKIPWLSRSKKLRCDFWNKGRKTEILCYVTWIFLHNEKDHNIQKLYKRLIIERLLNCQFGLALPTWQTQKSWWLPKLTV